MRILLESFAWVIKLPFTLVVMTMQAEEMAMEQGEVQAEVPAGAAGDGGEASPNL